jgi:hypothetical protein
MDDARIVASQLAGLGYLVRVLLTERLARMPRKEAEAFVASAQTNLPSPEGVATNAFINALLQEALATSTELRQQGGQLK